MAESTAGRLNLTKLTEIGSDGTTALPSRTFGYSRQTQYYEDSVYAPLPSTNCGPSWNVGTGFGCNLWSQSYEGNSYYMTSASNGLGLAQTFSWQNARDNTWGVPPGASLLDPFACDGTSQTTVPACGGPDDQAWSRIVLTQQTRSVLRLSQAGQGGAQTSTPVTGTYSYAYQMAAADSYWGDYFDYDVMDFYNERFMGFGTATVTNPDGSSVVYHYPQTLGVGVFNPNDPIFAGVCTGPGSSPCPASPWWDPANADHGRAIEVDRYDTNGALVQVVTTQYRTLCPSSGVTGDFRGQLVNELDNFNPVALCDIAPSQVDQYRVDGGAQASAPHLSTAYAYDAFGRVTSLTQTSNDGGGTGRSEERREEGGVHLERQRHRDRHVSHGQVPHRLPRLQGRRGLRRQPLPVPVHELRRPGQHPGRERGTHPRQADQVGHLHRLWHLGQRLHPQRPDQRHAHL